MINKLKLLATNTLILVNTKTIVFVGLLAGMSIPVSGIAQNELPPALKKAVKELGFSTGGLGLYVQKVNDKAPLLSFQSQKAFNPASVAKLVTTAAALGILGADYKWSTEVWYQGKINNNKLTGDLYFQGNGDPYLTPERFWRLLTRVSIFGINHIDGNVYFDASYFKPDPIDYSAFDGQPYRTYNVGPNAVLLGFQATEFHFVAAQNSVQITPFPFSPKLKIVNRVKAVNGPCGSWKKRLKMNTKKIKDSLQVSFSGRYSRGCGKRTLYRRVSDVDDHYQHFFLPIWDQLGGKVNGKVLAGMLPINDRDKTLAIRDMSIPVSEAIRYINKYSNNVMTRQLLLSLGAHQLGVPGTTKKGLQAVNRWLNSNNLDDSKLHLANGAGLSRDTRLTASMLGRLLHYVFQQPYMPEYVSSLPVSGQDGTMAHRFIDSPINGHAHIKTGLLDFVQTMAGYVAAENGERYVVVMLHNDKKAHTRAAEKLQDAVIAWVFNSDERKEVSLNRVKIN